MSTRRAPQGAAPVSIGAAANLAARRRARAMVALAALGTLVSGYLTWVHFSGALALCSGAGNAGSDVRGRSVYHARKTSVNEKVYPL